METENLYKIQKELNRFAKRLRHITIETDEADNGEGMEDFILDLKSYINDTPTLRDFYMKQVKKFEDYTKTPEYKNDIQFITKHMTHKNITYLPEFFGEFCPFMPLKVDETFIKNNLVYLQNCSLTDLFCRTTDFLLISDEIQEKLNDIFENRFNGLPEYTICKPPIIVGAPRYIFEKFNIKSDYKFEIPKFLQNKMIYKNCIDDLNHFIYSTIKINEMTDYTSMEYQNEIENKKEIKIDNVKGLQVIEKTKSVILPNQKNIEKKKIIENAINLLPDETKKAIKTYIRIKNATIKKVAKKLIKDESTIKKQLETAKNEITKALKYKSNIGLREIVRALKEN